MKANIYLFIYIYMPRKPKTRKQPKKQKTHKNNEAEEKKKTKWLTQLIKHLSTCRTKKCKEYIEKEQMINKEMFLAVGWSYKKTNGKEVMSSFDPSKRDEKKVKKYQRLSTKNNKDLKKCTEDYCKKEQNEWKKLIKQLLNIK